MTGIQSISHSRWECKYHIVWVPKYRKKRLFGELRKVLGPVLRELAAHRECEIIAGSMRPDHVVGYIKGKSAIWIARNCAGRKRNFTGQHFWARGYYVSTVGIDEDVIRQYVERQEEADRRIDQLQLFDQ